MKILLTLTLLFLTCSNAIFHNTENSIEDTNIHIINSTKKVYSLGSAKELQKAFGKAKITKELDEVLGGYAYFYRYKGFETYFNDYNWEATTIKDSIYIVFLNDIGYKVGDHISKLKYSFPISYQHRAKYNVIGITISHKKAIMDAAVNFSYNAKGYITMILISNDNS